jgi:hypothetical protein
MAVVRTVLPRKGIIQPRHGDNYEADLDANWQVIDSLLQDAADVQAAVDAAGTFETFVNDFLLFGVVSGFGLSTSVSLTPGLANGVLYAQGVRYAPVSAPDPGAAPASQSSYLFYNSTTGFYYNGTTTPATQGDALIGTVVTDASSVTSVTQAARLVGFVFDVDVTAPAAGDFTVAHGLGRMPAQVSLLMTSAGAIWFQTPTLYDSTNLYLVSSSAGLTARIKLE